MSKLETAVISLIDLFKEYSKEDEKKGQLSAGELKKLMETELTQPGFKEKFTPEELEEAMKNLDKNHDENINFREFCGFVSLLARGYYKHMKQAKK
ncbi:hypothetical protein SKAU_G00223880 [Synaphobranchus kaupii]|uniref:EF-hand domain-containing protein n=1 Tax=Synaphobranchus kaupii TaxID=118154 RepID=A0A9Q1FB95_SYNKA|nr:hypothetical protein SKAU_G00223880 [Synaphobranchus kaupii]